jgi:hypothetical protein
MATTRVTWMAAMLLTGAAGAEEFEAFDSRGLRRSEGVSVRVSHPAHWKAVPLDDPMALAELRGEQGKATGVLQIGRGRQRSDMDTLCKPERARTLLQAVQEDEGVRVTDVVARRHEGRPAYDIRYERSGAPAFVVVRSVIVCLKDSQLVVSCAAEGTARAAVAGVEPVCRQVLESLAISEE